MSTEPIVGTKNKEVRENWLSKELANIPKGTRILDAGAGELQYKKFCTHLDYVSQDFAQYNGQGDGKGLQTKTWDNSKLDIVSDITQIPQGDKSFGAIMCIEVLEHLPNPVLAIKELSRLLMDGGTMLITAPFCSFTHFAPFHFSTGFNIYFYEKHLEDNGLFIEDFQRNGNFFEYLAQELRRVPEIANKYTDIRMDGDYYSAQNIILEQLQKLTSADTGSEEFACLGYHIKAKKHAK